MAASNITIVGTQIKLALSLSLPDRLSMDNVDFAATFYTVSNRCVVISKRDMIRQDAATMMRKPSVQYYLGKKLRDMQDTGVQYERYTPPSNE